MQFRLILWGAEVCRIIVVFVKVNRRRRRRRRPSPPIVFANSLWSPFLTLTAAPYRHLHTPAPLRSAFCPFLPPVCPIIKSPRLRPTIIIRVFYIFIRARAPITFSAVRIIRPPKIECSSIIRWIFIYNPIIDAIVISSSI